MGKEEDLRRMFQELTGYEKKKIDLKMEGIPASPNADSPGSPDAGGCDLYEGLYTGR